MGASPSGCVEICGSDEDAHALETQRLIEEHEIAAEELRAKVVALENEALERAMQYSALQREHQQLSKVKDYMDKKGSKNSQTDVEVEQQQIRAILQEKASLESQTAIYAKACTDMESKMAASDNLVVALQQQVNEMKRNADNAADVASQKQRLVELEAALARERKQFEEQQALSLELEKRRQIRAKNVAVVNGFLTSFAMDSNFQTQLKNPRVRMICLCACMSRLYLLHVQYRLLISWSGSICVGSVGG